MKPSRAFALRDAHRWLDELLVVPAISAALAITGADRAHLVGYCIGGTLAAIAAAGMARDNDDRLKSLTLFAAQTDFTEPGELGLFIDDSQLALLEDVMFEQGVLESSQMAGTFHLMRSNDLVWSRVINHYLMGEPDVGLMYRLILHEFVGVLPYYFYLFFNDSPSFLGSRDGGSASARFLHQAPDRPADALVRAMGRHRTAGAG